MDEVFNECFGVAAKLLHQLAASDTGKQMVDDYTTVIATAYKQLVEKGVPESAAASAVAATQGAMLKK